MRWRLSTLSVLVLLAAFDSAPAQSPARPKPPAIKNREWIQIPLDAFVLHRLEAEQMKPAPEASRPEILTRLTLALVGRTASKAEIDAFVASPDKRAYEKTLDRLLADPAFDERFTDVRTLVRKGDPASVLKAADRCWRKLFGQPLSNKDALDWLTWELIDPSLVNCCDLDNIPASYDVKHLVRAICVSAIYRQSVSTSK